MVFGLRQRTVQVQEGEFDCPNCRRGCPCVATVSRRYFYLLGPLFPMGKPEEMVECQRCLKSFPQDDLQTNQAKGDRARHPTDHVGGPSPQGVDQNSSQTMRRGARVLARWDYFWYPGTVGRIDAQGLQVIFDDGDEGVFPPHLVVPLDLQEGDRVFARSRLGPGYFPGHLTSIRGDKVSILFEDGQRENTTVNVLRLVRGPADHSWKVGDRVLALWPPEPFLYPAVVKEIQDEVLIQVDYDDGDRAVLTPDLVWPVEFRVGQPVFARRNRSVKQYHSAIVTQVRPEEIRLRYDEGGEEWVPISHVRVLAPQLEQEYLRTRKK